MNDPSLLVVLPLITAFLLPIINRVSRIAALLAGPLILLISTLIGLSLWGEINEGAISVELGSFRPPLGITLYMDKLALLFALAVLIGTLLLWPRASTDTLRQNTLTLILAAGGTGLALSGDLFNIYVFYELVAVVSYGLIASKDSPGSFAASLRYLILSSFGAALALIGIAIIYQATGTLNLAHLAVLAPEKLNNIHGLTAFVMLLVGFGVKAELFPVNTWVPEVYATTHNRLAGLLAGIISKLALLIILRLLVLIFQQPEALSIMLALGILGILTGELAAWRARDFNRMLAFSSIGQLGIIFVAFSIPGKAALFAGLAVALHHLIVKPALFLLAERWSGSLSNLAGVGKTSPIAAALFVLLALSLVGVPPLPGFWAKLLVLIQLGDQAQTLYYIGAFVILVGAILEANYLFRVATLFYQDGNKDRIPEDHATLDIVTASLAGITIIASVFLLTPIVNQLDSIATSASDSSLYVQTVNPEILP